MSRAPSPHASIVSSVPRSLRQRLSSPSTCPMVINLKINIFKYFIFIKEHCISEYKTSAEELQAALAAQRSMKRGSLASIQNRHTSSESTASKEKDLSTTQNGANNELDDFDSEDSDYSDPESKRRRKSKKVFSTFKNEQNFKLIVFQQHPKFRYKDADLKGAKGGAKSGEKLMNGKKESGAKIRLNVCRYCNHSSAKSLQKHFSKV